MSVTTRETVAWCLDCHYWVDKGNIGGRCLGGDCPRTLVRRVGYLCQQVTAPFGYALRMPCLIFHRTVGAMKACDHDAY